MSSRSGGVDGVVAAALHFECVDLVGAAPAIQIACKQTDQFDTGRLVNDYGHLAWPDFRVSE